MDITFKDLIKLWGTLDNQKEIDLDLPIGRISTDSRTIEKGDFFVPLVGNKFDAHDYLDMAFDLGIQAAVVSEKYNGLVPTGLPHWVVPDTLYAYQQIALLHRRNLSLPVVAVTGSVGKTTTRELIRAILSPLGEIVSSRGNENNDVGVPKTLLSGSETDAAFVLEMGMRGFGQITRLSRVAEPDIAVITNVGQAHIGILGSRENIAKAKSEITSYLSPDGVVIIPFGDYILEKALLEKWSGRIVRVEIEGFSLNWLDCNNEHFAFQDIEPDYISQIDMQNNFILFEGRKFKLPLEGRHNAMNLRNIKWSGRIVRVEIEGFSLNWLDCNNEHFAFQDIEPDYISQIDMQNNFILFEGRKFKLPLEGRHNAMNFLLALTVATELGLSIKKLDQLKINMPIGRNRLVDCGQYLVLDETYNASPESVIASLELLVSKPGRHFAVLGTMLELGSESILLHQKVLKKAIELGLTGIVFVSCGEESNIIKKTIKELPNHDVVSTPKDAAMSLLPWLSPGDNILIKGSRKLELEKVLPYLQK